MFGAPRSFAHHVPPVIAAPGYSYWRAMELTSRVQWYIVSLAVAEGDEKFVRDLLVSRSADMISMASGEQGTVLSIQLVRPSDAGWKTMPVSRLWLGRDPRNPDRLVPIFESNEGERHCDPIGYWGSPGELIDLQSVWNEPSPVEEDRQT